MIFKKYTEEYINLILNQLKNKDKIFNFIKLCKQIKKNKKKIVIVGHGGSAAIASHFSVDMTKVGGIRCINFNESDLLTCFSNDYGYENWVVNALKFYADRGDMVILISSSGKSKNIVNAAKYTKNNGLKLITFSGFSKNNSINKIGHINFHVHSKNYNHIENIHQFLLLTAVDFVKKSELA